MGDMKLCRPYFWLVGSAIEIGSLPNPKLCRSYFYLKIFVWKKRQRIEKIKKSKIKKSRIRQYAIPLKEDKRKWVLNFLFKTIFK